MRQITLLLVTVYISLACAAQEHRPDYSAKDIGARQIAQREAQDKKPPGPPISLFAAPLVGLEKDLARAEKSHNLKFLEDALAQDFLEIAGNGQVRTKAEVVQAVHDIQISDYALDDFRSVDVRDDVGILTYTATVRGSYKGQPLPYRNLLSSVWHKQKGHWQMVLHTSTPIPLPPASAAELEGLEQDLVAREGDHDLDSLKQIFSPDAVVLGADGRRSSFAQFAEQLARGPKLAYKIADLSATPLGAESGVVTCQVSAPGAGPAAPPYRSTTGWKRGAGGWQVLFHEEAPGR